MDDLTSRLVTTPFSKRYSSSSNLSSLPMLPREEVKSRHDAGSMTTLFSLHVQSTMGPPFYRPTLNTVQYYTSTSDHGSVAVYDPRLLYKLASTSALLPPCRHSQTIWSQAVDAVSEVWSLLSLTRRDFLYDVMSDCSLCDVFCRIFPVCSWISPAVEFTNLPSLFCLSHYDQNSC
jgi:hypothetical protein